jgi:hypothetical protein
MAFKMKSGNTTNFKQMGSSPVKDKPVLTHDHDYGEEHGEKSPNKQKVFGGTESGKGNIFTKKGRTQRKINRYKKASDNIIKQVQKSGKDKTTGVWEDKKVKKAISKTNKRLSKTPKSFQDNLYLS